MLLGIGWEPWLPSGMATDSYIWDRFRNIPSQDILVAAATPTFSSSQTSDFSKVKCTVVIWYKSKLCKFTLGVYKNISGLLKSFNQVDYWHCKIYLQTYCYKSFCLGCGAHRRILGKLLNFLGWFSLAQLKLSVHWLVWIISRPLHSELGCLEVRKGLRSVLSFFSF